MPGINTPRQPVADNNKGGRHCLAYPKPHSHAHTGSNNNVSDPRVV
jgi:hypothetical protein